MPSYWWSCEKCKKEFAFKDVTDNSTIYHFIWKTLLPSNWDQEKLLLACPNCKNKSLRITYEFPRKDKEIVRVYCSPLTTGIQ